MTPSQEKTLAVLVDVGGWTCAKQIKEHGGSCASLPVLVETGKAEQRQFVSVNDFEIQEWRVKK